MLQLLLNKTCALLTRKFEKTQKKEVNRLEVGLQCSGPLVIRLHITPVCQDTQESSIWWSKCGSLLWVVRIYCFEAVKECFILLMEGANAAAVPTATLPPTNVS